MTFGEVPVGDAVGAVLAHTLRAGDRVLKKGRVLSAADVAALAASGRATVVCARLDAGELAEDAAATRIATALAGSNTRVVPTHTGRTNLHAEVDGLFVVDRAAIAAANAIDEAITVATVHAHQPVRAGEMVATVKIIPFGVSGAAVDAATEAVSGSASVRPWRGCRAGLVLTRFADTAPVILERAAAAQRTRMARCGGALV
ncbi:MAG TPA: 4-diphosphocytidyl-2C-methyl-D-erythritol kinase, partial [Kofleriaceae bacterium]